MMINGILGHPLKKPRSIKLWKKFFKKKGIKAKMLAFDIKPKKINSFFKMIKKNKNFRAMAVTMPYKKKVIRFLSKQDSFAKNAKAVNLIVKRKNSLLGYNTDVYGALMSINKIIRKYSSIAIIGMGGSGQSIFNFFFQRFRRKKFFLISSKFRFKDNRVYIFKSLNEDILRKKLLIVNCTPIGSNLKSTFENRSPVKSQLVSRINKKSFVFDIIYSPKKTLLSRICKKNKIKYTNGLKMNTLQADKALKIAFGKNI